MKKSFFFACVLFFVANSMYAQLPDIGKATQDISSMAGPGKLLTQFTDAIKPTSFLSSWTGQKSSWLSNAGKISGAVTMAQSISSLVGFLKPGSFKTGFNIQNLLQTANTVKTMGSATGLLKNLAGGLKQEALSDSWTQQQPGWLSALNLIK